jgi:hypothetical protein
MKKRTPLTKKSKPAKKTIRRKKPAPTAKRKTGSSRRPTPAKAAQGTQMPQTASDVLRELQELQKVDNKALRNVDPLMAMFVASNRIRDGVEVLSQFIDQETLVLPSKGGLNPSRDPASDALCRAFELLMHQVAQYARNGRPEFVAATWAAGLFFAEMIHELAANKKALPKLEQLARRSLYLPSLQARQPTFTYGFKDVAKTLHLGEDCISNTAKKAKHRLDTPITKWVADIVESIGAIQEQLRVARGVYQRIRSAYADPQSLVGLPKSVVDYIASADVGTEEQYLERHSFRPETLSYDSLPPLTKATADEWWDKAVKQEVSRLLDASGPEIKRLRQLVNYLKPYEQPADLRRRSKVALRTLARPTRQAPPPA